MSALPHNLEAEQALLGALMFDNDLLERLPPLEAAHFYDPVHGRIFQACAGMIAAGEVADGVTLKQRFARDGLIQEIGGAVYLMKLMDAAAPLTAQARAYAALIHDLARRRDLIRAGEAIAKMAANPPEDHDAEDLCAEAERLVAHVAGQTSSLAVSLREAAETAVASAKKGARGIGTGFGSIDGLIGGLFAPDVIVLAGRPSMGKSSLAANLAHSVALRGYGVHFASNEMSAEQLAQRALSRASYGQAGAFPYRAFRRGELPVERAEALIARMPQTMVIDETGGQTLAHLRNQARASRRRIGRLDLVVVDYLQLMRDEAIKRGETAEITALTKGIKQFAKDMEVAVLLLSQLSREVEKREDKRPHLSDLRQSGSIEQDADVVIFAYREHYYLSRAEPRREDGESNTDFDVRYHQWCNRCEETSGKMELIVPKSRMDETGSAFLTVDLAYDVANDPERSVL